MVADWILAGPRRWPMALFALRSEPRVSWCMHVPQGFWDEPGAYRLVVAVHGTGRGAQAYRDAFAPHADAHRWVVLAPLFPVGLFGDGNADGYKRLLEQGLRYDLLLLDMVAELEEVLGGAFPKVDLFGFSGGGHFAHRFLYLHPDRLNAVCVGAPGGVTLVDPASDWPLGVRDAPELFGKEIDLGVMRQVRVRLLAGGDDRMRLPIPPELLPRLGELAPNRVGLNALLYENLRALGLKVDREIVPGVSHEGQRLVAHAAAFFAEASQR